MTSRRVLLLHGPNLDLLGERQPEVYGTATLEAHVAEARRACEEARLDLEHLQAAAEAELVSAVHGARDRFVAIIVNPGALTHYGWSLHDALAAYDGIVIELHLSNPEGRESWRRTSVVAPVATGSITGLGGHGYALAIEAVRRLLE